MNRYTHWIWITAVLFSIPGGAANAEVRRDGGSESANRKAQYMIRQLHNEKQEIQAKLAEVQGERDSLNKELERIRASLEKSSENNEQLLSRVKGNIEKYNELAGKYREAVSILRKANMDNQYLVRAVQEREEWISACSKKNEGLYDANNDLLHKYSKVAKDDSEPFLGIGVVEVENEVQDFEFRLEDLQVTKFRPTVDTDSHARDPNSDLVSEREHEHSTTVN